MCYWVYWVPESASPEANICDVWVQVTLSEPAVSRRQRTLWMHHRRSQKTHCWNKKTHLFPIAAFYRTTAFQLRTVWGLESESVTSFRQLSYSCTGFFFCFFFCFVCVCVYIVSIIKVIIQIILIVIALTVYHQQAAAQEIQSDQQHMKVFPVTSDLY